MPPPRAVGRALLASAFGLASDSLARGAGLAALPRFRTARRAACTSFLLARRAEAADSMTGQLSFACRRQTTLAAKESEEAATRVRESGMPPVEYWETLVDPVTTLDRLGIVAGRHARMVELGCGYGTYTLVAAARVSELLTFDIDASMVDQTLQKLRAAELDKNVQASVRDVVAHGYGSEAEGCDAVLLFNILHCEDPVGMMHAAAATLQPGGRLYVTHWRHDHTTPRGPPLSIRPRPEQIEEWALATGILRTELGPVDCPPWHYGWAFSRI
ncbi:unnamed protein product [Polarella glacialis]|uniref:Methyltransferase domain-containing protein n=1 Tax=Polarella glacialis TaxID=89957 RepID=A0A813HC35_POLGL|nr:unnamed protein product [Polarella glacialis]